MPKPTSPTTIEKRFADIISSLRGKPGVTAPSPGHGRLMKEWLAVSPKSKLDWLALAKEALAFVGG